MINEYAFPNSTCEKTNERNFSAVLCYVKYYKLRYHILFFTADKTRLYVYAIGVYIIIWIVPRIFSHNSHSQFNPDKHYTHYVFHKLFCFNGILQFHKDVAEQLVYVYFASANFVWYIRTNQFIANFFIYYRRRLYSYRYWFITIRYYQRTLRINCIW
jgi:hypothetical protein